MDDRVAGARTRPVELGINYVDNNIDAECDLYGEAMAQSTKTARPRQVVHRLRLVAGEDHDGVRGATSPPAGMMQNIEARLKSYHTDMLDLWRPVGATWGPGQTSIGTLLMVSEKTLDMVVRVFEKAKQQGKVRFLGVSAHNPKVFRRVLNEYPQFSVIIFPYLFLTTRAGRRQPA